MRDFVIIFETVIYPVICIILFLRVWIYAGQIVARNALDRDPSAKEVVATMAISYLAAHAITSLFNRKTK